MTSYPFWVTEGLLPGRSEGYSYSSNPEILSYGETLDLPCIVSIPPINGGLPPGTRLEFINSQIQILGQISGVVGTQTFSFTLRLNNGTFSTDRTFYITATNSVDILEWQTSNTSVLGYYYQSEPQEFVVAAQNTPLKSITYSFPPVITWSQGVSIEAQTGLVTVDLSWKPTSLYSIIDYVFNNGYLYKCTVPGKSGIANGPYVPGLNIVDSIDPPWQPNTYYVINQIVSNDTGKLYVCLASGFSAPAGGPTGTGGYIPDGYPTAWQYIAQAAVWDQVTPGTIDSLDFTIIASTNTKTISKVFSVGLISPPHPPIWITPSGSLGTIAPGTNFNLPLIVFEPDLQSVAFSSLNLPPWLNLSILGELWGQAPNVSITTVYSFTVIASDSTNAIPQNFFVTVAQDAQQITWITPNDLGSVKDGEFSSIQFQAITTRPGASIQYGLRGGNIPPYTIVVSETGMLSGFVEYHAVSKTYYFEVSAGDGVDVAIQRFQLTVQSQNLEHYMSLQIPITGTNKLDFIINNSTSLMPPEYLFREADKNWSRNDNPAVSIINGLNYQNVSTVRDAISNYLTEFKLGYGNVYVSEGSQLPYQTLFVAVKDANSTRAWTPFSFYHSNERVSTSTGLQLVASVSGKSGDFPEPTTPGADGSVVWQLVAFPNIATSRLLPLPWYPQHRYQTQQTIVNQDLLLTAQTTGWSAGGLGPSGTAIPIIDNQVVWLKQNKQGPNQAFPASVYNIRQTTERLFGFSNAKGSGAQATASVNLSSGALTNIAVNSSGTGYYSQPKISVIGQGSGAQVVGYLGLQSGTIESSTPGFLADQEFEVTIGSAVNQQFGKIKIVSVNNIGVVTSIQVIVPGLFSHFPKGNITFFNGTKNFAVLFDLGISTVSILNPGQGYQSGAFIDFSGTELLPAWQEVWADNFVLSVPLAEVLDSGADWFKNNPFPVNPYDGNLFEVKQVELTVQGIVWTGSTTFDDDTMTWDVGQTALIEYEPASETIFDNNTTYFDEFTTEFDFVNNTNIPFSQVIFDENKTIFDYYSTVFNQRASVTASRFSRTWVLNFGKPWQ